MQTAKVYFIVVFHLEELREGPKTKGTQVLFHFPRDSVLFDIEFQGKSLFEFYLASVCSTKVKVLGLQV